MILFLWACADAPTHPSLKEDSAALGPLEGHYQVSVGSEWVGDCALSDPATHQEAQQEWALDPRDDILIVYPNFWDTLRCSLSELDFSCEQGSWVVEGRRAASLSHVLSGSFTAPDQFTAVDSITLSCADAGCDDLQALYGDDLSFPCTSTVAYEGYQP